MVIFIASVKNVAYLLFLYPLVCRVPEKIIIFAFCKGTTIN